MGWRQGESHTEVEMPPEGIKDWQRVYGDVGESSFQNNRRVEFPEVK